MSDEARLVQRVRSGERRAFVQLVKRYQGLVAHVVGRMVTDERDREELCQDVFVKVHDGLAGFRGDSKLSTWIGRIAYHHCLNHLEKRSPPTPASHLGPDSDGEGRRPWLATVAASGSDPEERAARAEIRRFVRREIEGLRPVQRAALTLYHLEGMSVAEVADVLELPEGTVKSHLHRGRKRVKERLLERHEPEELLS